MSHYTSETKIRELSEEVRRIGERYPKKAITAKALISTASDRTLPVEYRRQALLRFLNHHKEVKNASD